MALTANGVTWVGLVCNVLLAAGKITAGLVFASQAILADGLHGASDMITDLVVLLGLNASNRAADGCHPYGHRRVGTLVAMFVGAALLAAATIIVLGALGSLRQGTCPVVSVVPFMLAVITIPVKELLFRITRCVGQRDDNIALQANAWHHRSDAVTSVAAAIGLAGVALGGRQWAFLDSLTGIVLAAFLVVVSVRIMYQSAGELVDRAPGQATLDGIREVLRRTEGVRDFHALRARQIGGKVAMDVHILVDPDLTVAQGHEIASTLKHHIMTTDRRVVEAVVHVEPA
ncbi:MAG: cation diffusion facilitator family transporter [Phycisphaerae bacterium]|jgi:cation diffusion facilitator family transporter|nr:cation diffusion facilitator family transporter [Phycisphaerae bacterium]